MHRSFACRYSLTSVFSLLWKSWRMKVSRANSSYIIVSQHMTGLWMVLSFSRTRTGALLASNLHMHKSMKGHNEGSPLIGNWLILPEHGKIMPVASYNNSSLADFLFFFPLKDSLILTNQSLNQLDSTLYVNIFSMILASFQLFNKPVFF